MDSSSAAAEMVTLLAAAGYVAHLFPTGQGNVIGNPILPVIKLTANPRTARTMSEHIDYDCSGLLQRQKNLDQTGDELIEVLLRTCNGRLTAAEALGHREFVLTRLYANRARINPCFPMSIASRSASGAGTSRGSIRSSRCPGSRSQTVLDVVTHIQRVLDPDALLSLCLPRRHVRLVRDDGERQSALDLPHARLGRRGR